MNKVIYLLPKEGEADTRPSFPSTASIFPACLLRRQQGLLPWQLPSDRHGNSHRSLQLATLPLGHLHGNGRDGGAAGGLLGCACVEWREGVGRVPRRAQPQSTASVSASPGAAHLPASPPVRSPARWGSMAGSPLLRGPRAGGVGLLVLLLLGLLEPPPALCARPVKVRPGSGAGWGWGGGCYRRGSVPGLWLLILAGPAPGTCGEIGQGGPGSSRQSAPRPCRGWSLGCAGGSVQG